MEENICKKQKIFFSYSVFIFAVKKTCQMAPVKAQ